MEKKLSITCPSCGKIIVDDPLIATAVTGEGQTSEYILCECGERITFWAITAQLREQKTIGHRISNWFRSLFKK